MVGIFRLLEGLEYRLCELVLEHLVYDCGPKGVLVRKVVIQTVKVLMPEKATPLSPPQIGDSNPTWKK